MKADNPFDKKIEPMANATPGRIQGVAQVRDAAVYVADTLDLAAAAADSIFTGTGAHYFDVVFKIYDRIDAERRRLEDREKAEA
jgi:hypothetical protein